MMRWRNLSWLVVAALGVLASPALAQDQETEAGDTSTIDRDVGPLKNRIPPVSGHFFLHKGRFEVTPSVGLTINDAFFSKYVLGGSLTYYPAETIGIVLHGGYAVATPSSAVEICNQAGQTSISGVQGCGPPTVDYLNGRATGNLNILTGLDIQWAPIYGKIALLSEGFIHFDLYGILGPAAIRYEKADFFDTYKDASGATHSWAPNQTWTIGGEVGLGLKFFINKFITLHGEIRDVVYDEQTPNATPTASVKNQLLFDVGLSFFFPVHFDEG